MKIGIDLDGVIFNSEMYFMTMGEIFDCQFLKRNSILNSEEPRVQKKYSWSQDEIDEYINRFSCSLDFDVMPGAKCVIDSLRKSGNEIIIISARGQFSQKEKDVALQKLKDANIEVDDFLWGHLDKTEICYKHNIEVMIDDRYDVCQALEKVKVKSIYFHMSGRKIIEANDYIVVVNNWGEIYRYFFNNGVL